MRAYLDSNDGSRGRWIREDESGSRIGWCDKRIWTHEIERCWLRCDG